MLYNLLLRDSVKTYIYYDIFDGLEHVGLFDCFGDTFMVLVCQIKRKKTSEESDVEVDDKVKNGIKQFHPSGLIGFLLNLIFFEVGGKYDKLFGFEILQIHQ